MDFKKIIQFATKNNLLMKSDVIVVGLSGGPDSVFLLHFLKELQKTIGITLIAAHLDHEWRTDSANDVLFCSDMCKKLDVPFISARASELEMHFKKNGSPEALARSWRRSFLESVQKHYTANKIALAHHEQDQQETFFIRLIRGASLTGLTAMKPKAGCYIRPLLQTSKADIIAYLTKREIPYLTDSTNSSENYLRNRIRINVVPALQKTDPRFDANFLNTLESLQKTEQFLHDLTVKTYNDLICNPTDLSLDIHKLLNIDEFLQKRVLVHWLIEQKVTFTPTQSFLEEIKKFLKQTKSSSHALHTDWEICKKSQMIFIKKLKKLD